MAQVRLGELLVRADLIDEAQLRAALWEQKRTGQRLGDVLVDRCMLTEERLYMALSKISGVELLDASAVQLDRDASRWTDRRWAEENSIAPLWIDATARTLHVALCDPTHVGPIDELSYRCGLRVHSTLATEHQVSQLIRLQFETPPVARPSPPPPARAAPPPAPVAPPPARPKPPAGPVASSEPMILQGIGAMRDALHGTTSAPAPRLEGLPRRPRTGVAEVVPNPPMRAKTRPMSDSGLAPRMQTQPLHEGEAPMRRKTRPMYEDEAPARRQTRPMNEVIGGASHGMTLPPLQAPVPLPADALIPLPPEDDQDMFERLADLIAANQAASMELQAIFELCVATGVIDRNEYLQRLGSTPDG